MISRLHMHHAISVEWRVAMLLNAHWEAMFLNAYEIQLKRAPALRTVMMGRHPHHRARRHPRLFYRRMIHRTTRCISRLIRLFSPQCSHLLPRTL